jgi:hypothetical protein
MPHHKIKFKVNPPKLFTHHAEAIKGAFGKGLADHGVRDINVLYGYGPAGEVSFTVDSADATVNAEIVRIGERLRRGDTRTELLHSEIWLTPDERDAVGDSAETLAAYDAPYRHEDGGGSGA